MSPLLPLAALLLAAPPAPAPAASDLVRKSMTDYKLGYFDNALEEIEEAYRLEPRPALLFDLGQCHRAMAHWERAEFFYRAYLHDLPTARNRVAVLGLIDEMVAKHHAEEAAKAAAPTPAPAPSLVLVEAAPSAAPAAAVTGTTAEAKPTSRSHAWPWVLGTGAVVFAGGCAWGWYEAATFPAYKVAPHTLPQLQSQQTLATAGFVTAVSAGVIAAALLTGAVLTW